MRIAVEGCGHGTLHAIYASIKKSCEVNSWEGVDLLIIGGDFQAVRNSYDLNCMSVPQKFRAIGDFHEYYSGARLAPYLTLFVGGNHEASSHLQELYYGGWVAPSIYYLGAANVVRFGGLRIAALSGIWKGYNYNKPHFERLPYSADEVKSLYHVREIDVRKLLLLRTQVDVGVSHDWPRGVEWQGDWKALFRKKDLFEADARAGTLGSSAARYVMDRLRPPYWFAAHLHCKFAAVVDYGTEAGVSETPLNGENKAGNGTKNAEEIDLDIEDEGPAAEPRAPFKNIDEINLDIDSDGAGNPTLVPAVTQAYPDPSSTPSDLRSQLPASFARPKTPPPFEKAPPPPRPPAITNLATNFLALDKCLSNRKFLQILTLDPLLPSTSNAPPVLTYDKEWLAILRAFGFQDPHLPSSRDLGEAVYAPLIAKEEVWVEEHLVKQERMTVPENFEITAPVYDGKAIGSVGREQSKEYTNPQTKAFCEMLGIANHFDASEKEREGARISKGLQIQNESASGGSRGRGRGGGGSRGGHGGRGRGGRGRVRG
ncbi:MAG: hypothetical protein ASARMPREDX12_004338 [Alectoria sarmentosa]|nr:MAG: hypothetical protein ASARMPREDX12_004338 [Alectoria sarmentosa]